MKCRWLGAGMIAAGQVLTSSAPAQAQEAATSTTGRPIVLLEARYAAPTRWTAGLGALFPFGSPSQNGDLGDVRGYRGLDVEAGAGIGGARLALGPAFVGRSPGFPIIIAAGDLLASLTRTWRSPRGAGADSTYVGLEGGWTVLSVRVSAGLMHRVAGPKGSEANVFTWSVGTRFGW
jgi:hypothetical protein